MSLLVAVIQSVVRTSRVQFNNAVTKNVRNFSESLIRSNEIEAEESEQKNQTVSVKDASKDRTRDIPVETSIRYLNSAAYQETYGNDPVWKLYRRNHKGQLPPKKTRRTCIRNGMISTGNPCPICRDEYLVLDYRNIKLLKQFISEYNGTTYSYRKTGVCQKKHWQLLVAIAKAKDCGLITFDVPHREYNYADWYDMSEIEREHSM